MNTEGFSSFYFYYYDCVRAHRRQTKMGVVVTKISNKSHSIYRLSSFLCFFFLVLNSLASALLLLLFFSGKILCQWERLATAKEICWLIISCRTYLLRSMVVRAEMKPERCVRRKPPRREYTMRRW